MKRRYNADTMLQAVSLVPDLRAKMFPQGVPWLGQSPASTPEPQPEMAEGHCLGCKTKHPFQVEGEEKMKTGAIRKFGKCPNGHTISHFVAGLKDSA